MKPFKFQTKSNNYKVTLISVLTSSCATMEAKDLTKVKTTCRICTQHEDCLDMLTTSIANECGNGNVLLVDCYEYVTSIRISSAEEIFRSVCVKCSQGLASAYNLKKIALASHNRLIESLKSSYIIPSIIPEQPVVKMEIELLNDDTSRSTRGEYPETESSSSFDEPAITTDAVEFIGQHMADAPKIKTPPVRKQLRRQYKDYVCTICHRIFPKKSNLDDHVRLHNDIKPYKCKFCAKTFVQVANCRSHERIHTQERPFKCNICSKAFVQSSTLNIHIKTHSNKREYKCDECQKSFKTPSDLYKHGLIHNPDSHWRCRCGRRFTQRANYIRHLKTQHAAEDDEHIEFNNEVTELLVPSTTGSST